MPTGERARGRPEKKGMLEELLCIMLRGVSLSTLRQMRSNLDEDVFSGGAFSEVGRKYKFADIEVISTAHKCIGFLLGEPGHNLLSREPE